jgi:hypothetical protein
VLPNQLHIDITHEYGVNNEIANHNRLVRNWAQQLQTNDLVTTSIRLIKTWAKVKKIDNPCSGTLNSMGFLVMLLAAFEDCGGSITNERSQNELFGVVALLQRFFSKYKSLGRKREVIFAPDGAVKSEGLDIDISRLSSGVNDRDHRGAGTTLFIQDPFLPTINLGRFVDKYSCKLIRDSFAAACDVLESDHTDPFSVLVAGR